MAMLPLRFDGQGPDLENAFGRLVVIDAFAVAETAGFGRAGGDGEEGESKGEEGASVAMLHDGSRFGFRWLRKYGKAAGESIFSCG